MRATTVFLLGALLVVSTVHADHNVCTYQDEATLTIETPAGTYYAINDPCQPGCAFSIWVYEETNHVDGLQRGDACMGYCDVIGPGPYCEPDRIIL